MRVNGKQKAKPRRVVSIDGVEHVVLSESARRVVLYRLTGDFSDYRLKLGYTQAKMAKMLGITQGALSKLENGILQMKQPMARKIQQMLEKTTES